MTDPAIRQFIAKIKTQYGKQICEFQINARGEFRSWELTEFLKELGVNILTSVLHMHQQNGHVEHFIRTIMEKAQTIRLESCLPQSWWEFSVDYAIHIYNHTPIKQQTGCCLLKNYSTQNLMWHISMSSDVVHMSSCWKKYTQIN